MWFFIVYVRGSSGNKVNRSRSHGRNRVNRLCVWFSKFESFGLHNTYSVRSQSLCSRSWFWRRSLDTMALPWQTNSVGQAFGYAVWQCCTRPINWSIPLGATWVDYIPEVNDRIESHARRGEMLFEIYFQTNNTIYQFDLVKLVQRNATTRFERPIRRVFVPMPSRL